MPEPGVKPHESNESSQEKTNDSNTSSPDKEQSRTDPEVFNEQEDSQKWHQRHANTWGSKNRIDWHEKWANETWDNGRVLIIDYVSRENDSGSRRKVVAQEIKSYDGLRKYYRECYRHPSALRVVHIQNATWAKKFFMHKCNIDHRHELINSKFGHWAQYGRPQTRAGRPVLRGKTWKTEQDPWRGIRRTAFGMDFLKAYPVDDPDVDRSKLHSRPQVKMMELNCYNEEDEPGYGYDVYVQRLSVYVQIKDGLAKPPSEVDLKDPYSIVRKWKKELSTNGNITSAPFKEKSDDNRHFDNGNTIIIFEHAQSGLVNDTLIPPRDQVESRWRRLTFYLRREETENDKRLALRCVDLILNDVFKAVAVGWDMYLNLCETHVSILEDKIYENPADESRANELWTSSSLWLKVEKLMFIHMDILREMQAHLKEVADWDNPRGDWLSAVPSEYERLKNLIQEDLVKPTRNLSDLMYKSVEIRDSRQSLQLSISMWRLSWITFIFLPLTFTVGVFGMNVDVFENNPSLKWYFVVSIPFMLIVIMIWYYVKHFLATRNQIPYQRGMYERLFRELTSEHPNLWSRFGPRQDVVPSGFIAKIKWALLNEWFNAERTVGRPATINGGVGGSDGGEDNSLDMFTMVQRALVRRWLRNLKPAKPDSSSIAELGNGSTTTTELVPLSPPLMNFHVSDAAGASPAAAAALMGAPGERSSNPISFERSGMIGSAGGGVGGGGGGGGTGSRRRSRSSGRSLGPDEQAAIMVDENVLSDEEPFDDVADLLKLPDWQMPKIWKRTSDRW